MTTQTRAKAGGEYGVNGDWYEGGKFMPSREDRPKTAPDVRHTLTDAELGEIAARKARDEDYRTRVVAWRDGRVAQFADVLRVLFAKPADIEQSRWDWMLAKDVDCGFLVSLGKSLQSQGRLTEKQARYVVDAVVGRQTKKTIDEWWQLFEALIEDAPSRK